MQAKLYDVIKTVSDLAEQSVPVGSIGVIVAEFTEPVEAYEIEFSDEDGKMIAQIALEPNQFEVLRT